MEYKNVIKYSSDPKSLQKAWNTNITEQKALEIIYSYLEEGEVEVRFTALKRGRAKGGKSGWICLPSEASGHLTLGLTLHEVAHIIIKNDQKKRGHGKEFISQLDRLIWSELEWGENKDRYHQEIGF